MTICQDIQRKEIETFSHLSDLSLTLPAGQSVSSQVISNYLFQIRIKTDQNFQYHHQFMITNENIENGMNKIISTSLSSLNFKSRFDICLSSVPGLLGQLAIGIHDGFSPLESNLKNEVLITVNSLIDSPISTSCDPFNFSSVCNLRSALNYCENLLFSTQNATCLISCPPREQIILNTSFGSLSFQAESGELIIHCEDSRIIPSSSMEMRFLTLFSIGNYGMFRFSLTNCSINDFGGNQSDGSLVIKNLHSISLNFVTFASNSGFFGGAVSIANTSNIEITDCLFSNNTALNGNGGAISILSALFGRVILRKNEFYQNKATETGGGLFINYSAEIYIENCFFRGNDAGVAGGGIYFSNTAMIVLTSNNFSGNFARRISSSGQLSGIGGSMYFNNTSNATVAGGHHESNYASSAGAIGISSSNRKITLDSIIFSCNLGDYDSTAVLLAGAEIILQKSVFTQTSTTMPSVFLLLTNHTLISNCSFQNGSYSISTALSNLDLKIHNTTFNLDNRGGGLYFNGYVLASIERCHFENGWSDKGGAVTIFSEGTILISSSRFLFNTANFGGAIYSSSKNLVIENCFFFQNTASVGGGGIYLEIESKASIFDSIFRENHATEHGGGVFLLSNVVATFTTLQFLDNQCGNGGGAIYSHSNNTLHISSSGFYRNIATNGCGGIMILKNHQDVLITSSLIIANSARVTGVGGILIDSNNYGIVIQGCTLRKNVGNYGGGIGIGSNNFYLFFDQINFQENYASQEGGGIFLESDNFFFLFTRCQFRENIAVSNGGGVAITSFNQYHTLSNCSFDQNTAISGGAIYLSLWNEMCTIKQCSFNSNKVTNKGGAIYVYSNNHQLVLVNLIFANNSAMSKGGGVYLEYQNRRGYFDSVIFSSNTALNGGGLYLMSGNEELRLSRSTFQGNIAQASGGGVFIQDSNDSILTIDTLFEKNKARSYGGGIYLQSSNVNFAVLTSIFRKNQAFLSGGSFHSALLNDNLTFVSVEFFDSSGDSGGSIYIGSDHGLVYFDSVSFSRSIGNDGGALYMTHYNDLLFILNCSFTDGISLQGGGAITSFAAETKVSDSRFIGSVSDEASSLYFEGGDIYIVNSLFQENSATGPAGTGALTIRYGGTLEIIDTSFLSNLAEEGGAVSILTMSSVKILNCRFLNNSASSGGGLFVVSVQQMSIFATNFQGNNAGAGGSLYIADVPLYELSYVNHLSNVCAYAGCGLLTSYSSGVISNNYLINNSVFSSGGKGSALFIYGGKVSLLNNTFEFNQIPFGAGTVAWVVGTYMTEPLGLTIPTLNRFQNNTAVYGSKWATEGCYLRASPVYLNITEYGMNIPSILITFLDYYSQSVLTDSLTSVEVMLPGQECYGLPGYVTGILIEKFNQGVANFSSLQVFCAPGYSLTLVFRVSLADQIVSAPVTLSFRRCFRGEYFSGQECIPCEIGTFSLTDTSSTELPDMNQISICHPCPQHTSKCYSDQLVLKNGYWRISSDSKKILACPYGESACHGGDQTGDDTCHIGYTGPLCAVCQPSYAFQYSSQTCVPCSQSTKFDILDLIFFAIILLFFLFMLLYFSQEKVRAQINSVDDLILFILKKAKVVSIANDDTQSKNRAISKVATISRRFRARLKVYITLYQILSVLPFVLDLSFPSPVNLIISAMNFVNFRISGSAVISCSTYSFDFIDTLVLDTIYPIGFVVFLFSLQWAHLQFIRYRRSDESHALLEGYLANISSTYFSVFLIFTYLILPSVGTKIFQTFSCRDIDPDNTHPGSDLYLSADYSVSCTSPKYRFGFYWAIGMIFVYPIGCPLYYYYLLWNSRVEIQNRDERNELVRIDCSKDITDDALNRQRNQLSLKFLYESYHPRFWWWEIFETTQRLVLTGILVLIAQGSAIQIIVGALLTLIFLMITSHYHPYNDSLIFSIKIISYWQIYFVFWIALVIKAQFPSLQDKYLGICLILVIFANLFMDLLKFLQVFAMKRIVDVRSNSLNRTELNTLSSIEERNLQQSERLSTSALSPLHLETKEKFQDLEIELEGEL